ncbi:hypothetical protein CBS101457_006166 [Exobasidium rhododendri]|nr:hypothetical protein CBS101457_006166 [Exobasidium rhododendri]
MATSSIPHNSTQNQQHPFLFQPQQSHYNFVDDVDSPPSLTNSSESPLSTSEEGGSTSSHFDAFDRPDAAQGDDVKRRGGHLHRSLKDVKRVVADNGKTGSGEGEDLIMSPIQAVSPSWDAVFASSTAGDEMDLITSVAEADNKAWKSAQPTSSTTAVLIDSSNGGASDEDIKKIMARSAGVDMWSNDTSFQSWTSGNTDNRANDEAMFDSLIQEDSFDHSMTATHADSRHQDSAAVEKDNGISSSLLINTSPGSLPSSSQLPSVASASGKTPPQSTQCSPSGFSSRRNSAEQDPKQKLARIPHCGSHYSHTSDADLPTSSQVIVRPHRSELSNLQVHVHGISFSGAKSRVETQIRTRIELVRPVPGGGTDDSPAFERVGSFNHVKLPPLTGTKRKSKKHKPSDIAAEKTLFLDATVVRATPPHDRVLVCASCQQRERKRAQRKRTGSRKVEQRATDEEEFTVEELQEYGINPSDPDAQEQAQNRATQEDEKRVVVFNCGDFINFEEGACVLPTRITCYCRHHKEKTGFCLIFTMRDYRGNVVATGSTPPIMITDDHKSAAAAQIAASATNTPSTSQRRLEGARSRGVSTEVLDESTLRSNVRDTNPKKKRNHRTKPYGDAEDRAASRRNTLQNSSAMTPFASTGQNTPATGQSPTSQSDINHPEFWNAFAAMSSIATSPPLTSQSNHVGTQSPHDVTSPPNPTASAHQGHNSINGHDWLASINNQGSLSSQTLNLSPQSLPGFDLNSFTRSLQQSSSQAVDEATMQQLLLLARSMPGMTDTNFAVNTRQQVGSIIGDSAPVPTISKLIPGEGPTSGGIEVTVLGENFTENLTCLFGDVAATSTKVWGSNTLLCILPPSASPGPVAVSIKGTNAEDQSSSGQDRFGRSLQLFTYVDQTDRALMELALQVVGLQMTGQMQTARDVAMRVVGSGPNQSMTRGHEGNGNQHQGGQHHSASYQIRNAVPGMFAQGTGNQSFQDRVLHFLTTMDEDVGARRYDSIRLANKQGHTLLHLTVMMGFHRLALNLLTRGCPINARDHNGYTALHFAALHGRMTIARLLLHHGARFDVSCNSGKLPIDVAQEREHVDVEFLLEDFMGIGSSEEESVWSSSEEEEDDDVEDEIDADNISTQFDESVAADYSSEEVDDDSGDEGDVVEVDTPPFTSPPTPAVAAAPIPFDEKKVDWKAAEAGAASAATESETKSLDAKFGFKGLVSGGFDLAQKLQLSNSTMGKIGMPTALHDRLHLMHMPTVSVFQMVLPPVFMNWSGGMTEEGSIGGKGKAAEESQGTTPTAEESSRALTMWRNIFEESALWINPLYSSPPTYESSLQENTNERGEEKSGLVHSRFPAIAQASPNSPHKEEENKAKKRAVASFDHGRNVSSDGVVRTPSPLSNARSSTSKITSSASTSSSSAYTNRPTRNSKASSSSSSSKSSIKIAPRHLQEDRMLVYFWLPALIFVILLLCFASPTSVLSYKDLISYMPT